jgi:zinc protease
MNFLMRAVLLGILLSFSTPQGAEKKESLPSARQVLERYAEAIGGKAAFEKHRSQHVTGTVELPAQKLGGKLEVFAARPNKMLMKVTMPGLGEVTTGYDGSIGWMSTAITGPMLIEGPMIEEVATQADFDHSLHDPADYKVMEVLGKEEFNGEECHKLKLVHRSGFESTEFFSVKTGLQIGFIATQQTQFGPVRATTIVSDYKRFGDLLLPARTIQKASGIETVMTIQETEYDRVDPAIFELPADVQTLLEQRKKAADAKKAEKKSD